MERLQGIEERAFLLYDAVDGGIADFERGGGHVRVPQRQRGMLAALLFVPTPARPATIIGATRGCCPDTTRESRHANEDVQVYAHERNHPRRPWVGVSGEVVAAMDAVGVDGAILVSPLSLYRYDGYALEVRARYPGPGHPLHRHAERQVPSFFTSLPASGSRSQSGIFATGLATPNLLVTTLTLCRPRYDPIFEPSPDSARHISVAADDPTTIHARSAAFVGIPLRTGPHNVMRQIAGRRRHLPIIITSKSWCCDSAGLVRRGRYLTQTRSACINQERDNAIDPVRSGAGSDEYLQQFNQDDGDG